MTASVDPGTAVVMLTVHGGWNQTLRRDTFLGLKMCLSGHPPALIIDLRAMNDPRAGSAATWLTARNVGDAMTPAVPVAACIPTDTVLTGQLDRLDTTGALPIYTTVAHARAALTSDLPPTTGLRLLLPADPTSPALARSLITDACTAWQLPELLHPARQIISELAANTVQHARTPMQITLHRRGTGLHLAVIDDDPRPPRLIPAPDNATAGWDRPGNGLRTVHTAATAWGCIPTTTGKMVWATIHPRDHRRQPRP